MKKGKRKGKRYSKNPPTTGEVFGNVHSEYFKNPTTTITSTVQPNRANEALLKMRGDNNE